MRARILLMCLLVRLSVSQEPHCSSFTFLEQLLEKLVRMESRVVALEAQIKAKPDSSGKYYSYASVYNIMYFICSYWRTIREQLGNQTKYWMVIFLRLCNVFY